jgi:hypothetical protein
MTTKEYNKEYYKKNREAIIEKKKAYNKGRPAERLLSNLKQRAKRKQLPFDLDISDIEGVSHCPVFGFELKRNEGKSFNDSISIDRKDSTKGYTKDNIQILSQLANTMKSSASKEELIMFAKWVFKTYGETL